MIKEIAFTAYRVTDMAAARAFYEQKLGLSIGMNHADVWVEYDVAGATFAIQTMTPEEPSGSRGLVAFEVDDLQKTVADLKATGVPVTMYIIETGVCWMATVDDPDGNSIVLHQRKPGNR